MAEKKLKRLPLGMATFSELIQDDYVYVDKTKEIYQMITGSKYYFLSRPRRFGKSLLVSTLGELFAGNKKLFKDLWITGSDYAWPQHPIIRFDFSTIANENTQALSTSIIRILDETALTYNVNITNIQSIKDKFASLISTLAQKNKVVILIDEYDKPILDHIDNSQEAKAQREVLKSFYSVIKGSDQYVRFVLLTGVSKFAKTSIFSGINNLSDISLDIRYATMLGYTQHELIHYFAPHIQQLAQALKKDEQSLAHILTQYYDGYQFVENAERIFNPYSILLCFDTKNVNSYWFQTGTPTFLITLLQKNDYDLESITHPVLNQASLGSFEPDDIPLPNLLFQTGYLTIKDYDPKTSNYTLGIPNKEVNDGLTIHLTDAYTRLPANKSLQYARRIAQAFGASDMVELHSILQEFFNRMPYTVHIQSEHSLQFVLYSIFALIGVTVDPEVTTSLGRADLVVTFPKLVYVIELKFNQSASVALAQIQDKKYYEKYLNMGKEITLLGIGFDKPTKTISLEWSRP